MGKKIAELCKAANIEKVCFDRGGNIYHGRVKVRLPSTHVCTDCSKLGPKGAQPMFGLAMCRQWQMLRVKQALFSK